MRSDSFAVGPADSSEDAGTSAYNIEVLEWGKYCERPNGAVIPRAEHMVLGASHGFPEDLRTACNPLSFGIAQDDLEEEREGLFREVPYGTVIRSVTSNGRRGTLCYRVGIRAERTDARSGRMYSLGKYLLDLSCQVSPRTLWRHLGPLVGLTSDQAKSLVSFSVRDLQYGGSERVSAVATQARVFLLSGIPLHFQVTEEEFFVLVDAIWTSLPATLRPLISAGWNVSRSVGNQLTICACTSNMPERAEYGIDGWRASPTGSLLWGELFHAVSLGDSSYRVNELLRGVSRLVPARGAAGGKVETSGSVESGTMLQFQMAVAEAASSAIVALIQTWLQSEAEDESTDTSRLIELIADSSIVCALLTFGYEQRERWRKADRLLWRVLSSSKAFHLNLGRDTLASRRAELLATLLGNDPVRVVEALLEAAASDAGDEISADPAERLGELLDESIHLVDHHANLLPHARRLSAYAAWLPSRAWHLALAFSNTSGAAAARVDRLCVTLCELHQAVPEVSALRAILSLAPPTTLDETALLRLGAVDQASVCRVLNAVWSSASDAMQRTNLCGWAKIPWADTRELLPVLRAARGETLGVSEILTVVADLSSLDGMSSVLLKRLSENVLQHEADLHASIVENAAMWAPIVRLWPPAARLLILQQPVDQSVSAVGSREVEYIVGDAELRRFLDEWSTSLDAAKVSMVPAAAATLWRLAVDRPAPRTPSVCAADLCWSLGNGRWLTASDNGDAVQIDRAVWLARLGGKLHEGNELTDQLWSAAKHGLQLVFLMRTFPAGPFLPSVKQLEALIPFRAWLRQYLVHPQVSAKAKSRFAVAQYDFGELAPDTDAAKQMLRDYPSSSLLGAIRGHSILDAFSRALTAYSTSNRETARLCLHALGNGMGAQKEIGVKVVHEVMGPWIVQAQFSSEDVQELCDLMTNVWRPRRRSMSINAMFDADPLLQKANGPFIVADYVVPLLWQLLTLGLRREVVAASFLRERP